MAVYHMGILWICYGYPVVMEAEWKQNGSRMEAEWKLNGRELLREGIKVYIRVAGHI